MPSDFDAVEQKMAEDGIDLDVVTGDKTGPIETESEPQETETAEVEAAEATEPEEAQSAEEVTAEGTEGEEPRGPGRPSYENVIGERNRLREQLKARDEELKKWQQQVENKFQQLSITRPPPQQAPQKDLQAHARDIWNEFKSVHGYSDEDLRNPMVQRLIKTEALQRVSQDRQADADTRFAKLQEMEMSRQNEAAVDKAIAAAPELSSVMKAAPELADGLKELVFARWLARFDQGETAQQAVAWLNQMLGQAAKSKYSSALAKTKARTAGPKPIGKAGGGAPSLAKRPIKGPAYKTTKDAAAAIKRDYGIEVE